MPPPKAIAKHGSHQQAPKYRSPKRLKKAQKAETHKGSNKTILFLNAFPHGVVYATPKAIDKHGSHRQALKYRSPKSPRKTQNPPKQQPISQAKAKSLKAETHKGSNKTISFLNAFPHGVAYSTPQGR